VIGRAVFGSLTAAHPSPRITITPEPVTHFALRLLPKRWADRLYARALGLRRARP